jgi:peptidoglycan/LPS O-acetylase OafA/YrhL
MIESPSQVSRTRFVDSTASVLFDLLRGVAALLVFLEHGRNLFFVDFQDLTSHRLLLAVPYVLSVAGHQAVVVFFVLSGFFISGTVFRAVERNQWLWTDYLTRRLVRLWVVLVPALLLCLLWDKLGIHLGHAPALYSGNVDNHMVGDISRLLSPSIFFGNLLFLQAILVQVFGSDGALWSLAYEFWYYILFPLGFFTLRSATPRLQRLVCGTLFLAIAWFVREGILAAFPIWLTGTLLVLVPPPRISGTAARCARILAACIYPLVFFGLAKVHSLPGLVGDYLLTVATFALLWILLSANSKAVPGAISVRASREVARFSYTLYAVHTPLLVFIASLVLGDTRWVPTPAHIVTGLAIACIALGYAYGLASFTEFRTDAIRRYVERLLHLPDPPSALPSNPNTPVTQITQK